MLPRKSKIFPAESLTDYDLPAANSERAYQGDSTKLSVPEPRKGSLPKQQTNVEDLPFLQPQAEVRCVQI
jgi:hypothetical protein